MKLTQTVGRKETLAMMPQSIFCLSMCGKISSNLSASVFLLSCVTLHTGLECGLSMPGLAGVLELTSRHALTPTQYECFYTTSILAGSGFFLCCCYFRSLWISALTLGFFLLLW